MNSNRSSIFCVGKYHRARWWPMIVFFSPNVQGKTPVSLKGQCSEPQDQIDVFMCYRLLQFILPVLSFHFWTMTFLISGLLFPEFLILSCFCLGKETKSLPSCLKYYLAFYSFYVFLGIYYILLKGFLLGTHWHFIGHQFLLRQLSFWDFFFSLGLWVNCTISCIFALSVCSVDVHPGFVGVRSHFTHPRSMHKQEISSTCMRISLCDLGMSLTNLCCNLLNYNSGIMSPTSWNRWEDYMW